MFAFHFPGTWVLERALSGQEWVVCSPLKSSYWYDLACTVQDIFKLT